MTLHIKATSKIDLQIKLLDSKKVKLQKLFKCKTRKLFNKKSRAVFLIGSGRSGTDIMAHCLDQLIDIKLINESNPLAFNNWRLKNLDVVKTVVNNSGAPVVVFKPIVETMRINELLKIFPDSRAIFLVRFYGDAINSMVNFFGEKNIAAVNSWVDSGFEKFELVPDELKAFTTNIWLESPTQENASGIYWLIYNSSYYFMELKNNERVCLANYGSLVTKPKKTLTPICEFLGLAYKEKMIKNIYSSSQKEKATEGMHSDLVEQCEKVWSKLQSELKR